MRVYTPYSPIGELPSGFVQEYRIESLAGLYADGADITGGWPDVSGSGFNLPDSGAGNRPNMRLNALGDGIMGARFNGANSFLRVAVTNAGGSDLTIYAVVYLGHVGVGIGGTVPWSLGRVGVLSNAVGCARGIIGAASFTHGAQANNLSGAVARGGGFSAQDGLAEANSAGLFFRRAFAFRWSSRTGNWIQSMFVGDTVAMTTYGAAPPANNFSYTNFCLGAEHNGGGAPLNFFGGDWQYFARATTAHMDHVVHNKLLQLRQQYNCY